MNSTPSNQMVFVPAHTFANNPGWDYSNDYSPQYMGSMGAGSTPHANDLAEWKTALAGPRNINAAHAPIMHRDSDKFLDYAAGAQVVKTPQAGGKPGIWIEMDTAVALGLMPRTSVPPISSPAPAQSPHTVITHNVAPMNAQRVVENRGTLTIAASSQVQQKKKSSYASIGSSRRSIRRMTPKPSY